MEYVYVRTRAQKTRDMQIALCTCPWCHLVWEHHETPGQPTFDLEKTRQLIGAHRDIWTCPECKQDSRADILREKRERVQKTQERSR